MTGGDMLYPQLHFPTLIFLFNTVIWSPTDDVDSSFSCNLSPGDDDGCLDIDELSKEDEEMAMLGARLPYPQWDILILLIFHAVRP
jgi:hypothetical protein